MSTMFHFCEDIDSFSLADSGRWARKLGYGEVYRAFRVDATMWFIHDRNRSQRAIFLYFLAATFKYGSQSIDE